MDSNCRSSIVGGHFFSLIYCKKLRKDFIFGKITGTNYFQMSQKYVLLNKIT